jgi:hypothetical protein
MSLPLNLHSKFTSTYDGFPTAVFTNSVEYHNFTTMLNEAKASFKTKISKHKKRGREFLVMLVVPADGN